MNKYEHLSKHQAEFDFHGKGILNEGEIKRMADDFLSECRREGFTKVLFITGKGLHSKGGSPVIKPLLHKYLSGLPFVLKVYDGRIDRGGSGALEVVLGQENGAQS